MPLQGRIKLSICTRFSGDGKLYGTDLFFEPYVTGSHSLAKRIVMNPMTRCRADADAVPMAIMATYYGQRAAAGLIITEGTAPSANGRGYTRQPGLWTDAQVAGAGGGWKAVTAAVKAKGGTIFAQLMHTGGVSHKANMTAAARVIAPSAVALAGQMYNDTAGMQDYPVTEAVTAADIVATKAEIVASTRNAIAAGFDGVERHRANGERRKSSSTRAPTSASTAMAALIGPRVRRR